MQGFGNLLGTFGKTALKEIVGNEILYSLTNILMKIPQIICDFLTGIGFCVINHNLFRILTLNEQLFNTLCRLFPSNGGFRIVVLNFAAQTDSYTVFIVPSGYSIVG